MLLLLLSRRLNHVIDSFFPHHGIALDLSYMDRSALKKIYREGEKKSCTMTRKVEGCILVFSSLQFCKVAST